MCIFYNSGGLYLGGSVNSEIWENYLGWVLETIETLIVTISPNPTHTRPGLTLIMGGQRFWFSNNCEYINITRPVAGPTSAL